MEMKELLETYYTRLKAKDFAGAVELFADEGEVSLNIAGRGPIGGSYQTKDAILKALTAMEDGRFGEVKRGVHTYCLSDDGVHACVQYTLRFIRDGVQHDFFTTDGWHLHGGRLEEVWTTWDDTYVFDEWTGKK